MDITFENLGFIKKGNIKTNDITIIFGPNNVGKFIFVAGSDHKSVFTQRPSQIVHLATIFCSYISAALQ
ncbi:hypothetical protein [Klebsiella quasipneumoniae]|uniref:hypothetical protein n=1 Tax=Klebsiella quasipneumoniae TaxID=1463165 RepID=UPI003D7894D7